MKVYLIIYSLLFSGFISCLPQQEWKAKPAWWSKKIDETDNSTDHKWKPIPGPKTIPKDVAESDGDIDAENDIEKKAKDPEKENICVTEGCVKAAASFLKFINQSIDPCENFYDFSCGTFLKNERIPDDKSTLGSFDNLNEELMKKLRKAFEEPLESEDSEPMKMVKDLYHSCINEEMIEKNELQPLKEIHQKLGGWPVVDASWEGDTFEWIDSVYATREEGFSINNFFSLNVDIHQKDSSKRILSIDQPQLGMTREYLMKGLEDKDVRAYLKYSIDTAVLMGADKQVAENDMLDVLNFQIALANISLPREQRRDVSKLFNLYTLKDLSEIFPGIPFVTYINTVMQPVAEVDENEIVSVSDINYLKNFTRICNNTPKRTLANYQLWRITAASASFLSKNLRDLRFEYTKGLLGLKKKPPRWKQCVYVVRGRLSYAVSNLYINKYFNDNAKEEAFKIVDHIREEFDNILNTVDWMDAETTKNAKKKASAMKNHIAYPPEVMQIPKLMEFYGDLMINRELFFENVRQISKFGMNKAFAKLRQPVDKEDWKRQGDVAVVNAYYSWVENAIKFPAGILQGTFFEKERPNYLNFGAIGYVIGHEITHGFDDQGKLYDENGEIKNWWQPQTEERFLKKAKCIIDQYGAYVAPENGMQLNGVNTQGENIADNGGIKQAYRAYQKWVAENKEEPLLPGLTKYTPNQLFWMSAAQVWCSKDRPEYLKTNILNGVHPPGRFRITGIVSNSEEFSKDFKCSVGSPMNPEKKCAIW